MNRPLAGRLVDQLSWWLTGRPDGLADRLVDDVDQGLLDMRLITRPDAGPAMLLPERLRLSGRDPVALEHADPALLRLLELRCIVCPHWRRCARDIAHGVDPPGAYCANAHWLAN